MQTSFFWIGDGTWDDVATWHRESYIPPLLTGEAAINFVSRDLGTTESALVTNAPTALRAPKLPALTSLRFFAAAGIVVLHSQGHFGIPSNLSGIVAVGHGVSMFFVLSGFVLTYSYPSLETNRDAWRFLIARAARIWPAHITALVFFIWLTASYYLAVDGFWIKATLNLAMIQSWIPDSVWGESINGPSWSISTEFAFYLLFPLLISKFAQTWHWKLLTVFAVAFGMVALTAWLGTPYGGPSRLTAPMLTYMHPLARLPEFVIGMCAALLYSHTSWRIRLDVWSGTALEVLALSFMFTAMYVPLMAPITSPLTFWFYSSFEPAIPAAVLIFVLALRCGFISRAMEAAWLVILGEISYSIYLFHRPLLGYYWANLYPSASPWWVDLSIFASVLFCLSLAVWYFIETPARKMVRRLLLRTAN